MKIKSYNLFLESKSYDISKEEENNIKQYFIDRLDGEFIDGKEINEYIPINYHTQPINTFIFIKSLDSLDKNGECSYNSKILKEKRPFFWDSNKKSEWEREFKDKEFSIYSTIVVNINFESNLIIPYLEHIYKNLIDDDYLVSAWHTDPNIWRFHIATKTSNPFQVSENLLSSDELF